MNPLCRYRTQREQQNIDGSIKDAAEVKVPKPKAKVKKKARRRGR